jgi:enterochelin esterase-like enzyme
VLYLSHGFSDNEKSWTTHGKAHWIMDNLIAQKKAQPMIIVMPDGHAIAPGSGWKDEYGKDNTAAYCQDLVNDVLPLVESTFKVDASPDGRAFAGLSMGGRHAIAVGLTLQAKFHWIGAFSAAPPSMGEVEKGMADSAGTNAQLKLFWIACGKEDFLFQQNEAFHKSLSEKGIKHDYRVTEGDHSWPIWREYFAEFAPQIFKK